MTGGKAGSALGRLRGLGTGLDGLPAVRRWAIAASLVWVVVVVAYGVGFWSVAAAGQGRGTLFLDALFFLLTLTVPLVLVWLAAWLAVELARQRELIAAFAGVTEPLIESLAATRAVLAQQSPTSPDEIRRAVEAAVSGLVRPADLAAPLERLAIGQSRLQLVVDRIAAPQPKRTRERAPEAARDQEPELALAAEPAPAAPAPAGEPEQPALPHVETAEPPRPDWATLVRALDFPRDADDRDGFRALKVVLRHHGLAQVLQSAEDVLNLLAQQGVFVDDLEMAPIDVAAWRRFMTGVRGPDVAGIGGISDARALDAARGLMRSDSIFRDAALFFQRRFDRVLADYGREAGDEEIAALASTRSGRAFMLLLRLSGSLD